MNGTRLRIGDSETVVPVGLTGYGVYRRLVGVPAAVPEATAGRNALRQNALMTVTALASSALIWLRVAPIDRGIVSKRLGIVGAIGIVSIFQWQRNARSADAHFEKAVEHYNRELTP